MATHVFRPYVFVTDDGEVSFDWEDCFVYSVDAEGWDRTDEASDASDQASFTLDRFVARRNLGGSIPREEA